MGTAARQTLGGLRIDGRFRPALLAGLALALAAALLAAGSARAAEQPFRIQFDQSELTIGALGDLGGLPLEAADQNASIEGSWNPQTGRVTVPKGKFILPGVGLTDPVNVKIFLGIENAATGSFDPQTGALELDAEAGLWVSLNVKQLLELLEQNGIDPGAIGGIDPGMLNLLTTFVSTLTCGFSPMDVRFTTGATSLGAGVPFTKGPAGAGTLVAEWSQLGPFAGRTRLPLVNIDPCLLIRDMLPGLIGNLGGSESGLGDLDLSALLAGIDNLNLGPSGIALIRTVDDSRPPESRTRKPRLDLTVTALGRKVKPPWRAAYRVKVKNVGGESAKGSRVCMTGFAVKRNCFGLGKIAAGGSRVRTFRTTVRRQRLRGRYQVVLRPLFTARAKRARTVSHRGATIRLSGA